MNPFGTIWKNASSRNLVKKQRNGTSNTTLKELRENNGRDQFVSLQFTSLCNIFGRNHMIESTCRVEGEKEERLLQVPGSF